MQRRKLLRIGGLGLAAGLAGCSSSQPTSEPGDDTDSPTATPGGATAEGTPGADQLGAKGDLQSDVTVRAAVLEEDQGAGRFVFTPAVVWVEQGTTVTWEIGGRPTR